MASILVTKGINAGDYYPLGTGSFTAGRDAKNTARCSMTASAGPMFESAMTTTWTRTL